MMTTRLVVCIALIFAVLDGKALLASAHDDDDDDIPAITCGSVIKLQHTHTASKGNYLLYDSEGKNRNGGSGQHLATFVKDDPAAARSLWRIRPRHHVFEQEYPDFLEHGHTCKHAAEPVKCGDIIRLTNLNTGRNLHSHDVKSPLSSQQEVSVFEGKDKMDEWKVECKDNATVWKRGQGVKLKHLGTDKCLGASVDAEFNTATCGRNCPLMDHLESFARACNDALTDLQAEQGIYLSL